MNAHVLNVAKMLRWEILSMTRDAVLSHLKHGLINEEYPLTRKDKQSILQALEQPLRQEQELLVDYSYDGYYDGEPVLDMASCPTCSHEFEDGDINWQVAKYCPECGQRIKWKWET